MSLLSSYLHAVIINLSFFSEETNLCNLEIAFDTFNIDVKKSLLFSSHLFIAIPHKVEMYYFHFNNKKIHKTKNSNYYCKILEKCLCINYRKNVYLKIIL